MLSTVRELAFLQRRLDVVTLFWRHRGAAAEQSDEAAGLGSLSWDKCGLEGWCDCPWPEQTMAQLASREPVGDIREVLLVNQFQTPVIPQCNGTMPFQAWVLVQARCSHLGGQGTRTWEKERALWHYQTPVPPFTVPFLTCTGMHKGLFQATRNKHLAKAKDIWPGWRCATLSQGMACFLLNLLEILAFLQLFGATFRSGRDMLYLAVAFPKEDMANRKPSRGFCSSHPKGKVLAWC